MSDPKSQLPNNKIDCDHPLDKRRFGLRGGVFLSTAGDATDNIVPYEYCSECNSEIPEVEEEIIF